MKILNLKQLKTLNESVTIGKKNLSKYTKLVQDYFHTKLGKIYSFDEFDTFRKQNSEKTYLGLRFFLEDMRSFRINWIVDIDTDEEIDNNPENLLNFTLDSVDFWTAEDPNPKVSINIDYDNEGLTSIAVVLPLILEILAKNDYDSILGKTWDLNPSFTVSEENTSTLDELGFTLFEDSDIDEDSELNEVVAKKPVGRPRKTTTTTKSKTATKSKTTAKPKTPRAKVVRAKKDVDTTKTTKKAQAKLDNVEYADVDTIFEDLDSYVEMVAKNIQPSLLVTGLPGTGKTYTITDKLNRLGLTQIDTVKIAKVMTQIKDNEDGAEEIDDLVENSGDWAHIKGMSTPFGLFKTLYMYRDKLIVFDDCDSIFKDENSTNILKGALDSYDVRRITWQSDKTTKGNSMVPSTFEFRGRIIFISNLYMKKVDSAVRSRSFTVDITLKASDVILRMKSIINTICPEYKMNVKLDALNAIKEAYDKAPDDIELNMRTWIKAMKIRMLGELGHKRWKEMIMYQCREIK